VTLAENVNRAITDFGDIKNSIINQGVGVPAGTPTKNYAGLIDSIAGESGVIEEIDFPVGFQIIGAWESPVIKSNLGIWLRMDGRMVSVLEYPEILNFSGITRLGVTIMTPPMTANNKPEPFEVEASSEWNTYPAWNAFRQTSAIAGGNDCWASASGDNTPHLTVTLDKAKSLVKYILRGRKTGGTNFPIAWTFLGSNDKINWEQLDERSGQTSPGTYTAREYNLSEPSKPFKYFRIHISSLSQYAALGELELYEDLKDFALLPNIPRVNDQYTFAKVSAINPPFNLHYPVGWQQVTGWTEEKVTSNGYWLRMHGTNIINPAEYPALVKTTSVLHFGANENVVPKMTANNKPEPFVVSASSLYNSSYPAWKAFDRLKSTDTDCWATDGASNQWIMVDLGEPMIVRALTVMSTDKARNAPKDMRFEGSHNKVDFEVILNSLNNVGWGIHETRLYKFTNNTAYRYYRLFIVNVEIGFYIALGGLEFLTGDEPFYLLRNIPEVNTQYTYVKAK